LNQEKWGGNKVEEKDDRTYYYNDKELQTYVWDMIKKVAEHNHENIMRQNDTHIGEYGLK
jgi:hypothetical protein